jgi:hypothetical protein
VFCSKTILPACWSKNCLIVINNLLTLIRSNADALVCNVFWPNTTTPDLGNAVIGLTLSAYNVSLDAFGKLKDVLSTVGNAPLFRPAGANQGSPTLSLNAYTPGINVDAGALPTVLKTSLSLPKASRDTLYADKVNPITAFPRSGVVVFGQKTLQTKASAFDRINVRRLLITIKQFLDQQAGNIVFEQNTVATRNNFLAIVNPYRASVQQRQGLYAFKVVMDETINTPAVIDRNELVGQVFLQPTKTAEFIILNFNVQPTGASFPEAGASAGGY